MTVKIDLALESIFKTNSLRNLTTIGNNPMPHKGDTYYLWVDSYETELGKYLTENNKWGYSSAPRKSINSYINLKDDAVSYLVSDRLIQYGPASNSSSFTIRVWERDNGTVRVTANGWGSSVIELFDGLTIEFLDYLRKYQVRQKDE